MILGDDSDAGRDPLAVARAAVGGGASIVQVRWKNRPTAEVAAFAAKLRAEVGDAALVVVNDDVDAALAAGADGVHVGQDDAPIERVRARAGDRLLVGVSTHSLAQAIAVKEAGADLIGIGAMFATATKTAPVVIGPAALEGLPAEIGALPVFPIGGIDASNVNELVRRGVRRAAVSRAITHADDPRAAAAAILRVLSGGAR